MLKKTRILCVLFAAGLAVDTLLAAASGTIVGTVTDETGAVIPGAVVAVTHQGTGAPRSLVTDAAGNYNFPLLPVGRYTARVDMPGSQTFVQRDGVLAGD